MKPMFEVADAYRRIIDQIEEAGGEITPEIEAALDAVEGDLTAKVDALSAAYHEFNDAAEIAKAHADRYAKRKKVGANAAARVLDLIKQHLERAGLTSLDTGRFKPGIQASNPSARWTGDPGKIPAEFKRIKIVEEFDGAKALEYRRLKRPVPPEIAYDRGTHVRMR